ncbi:hypothetical protein [Chromatium okenii]|uniref:hypothetical protein n=1 Tax=Chromatium okenii TaxID=61644 RepID=UPI001558DA3F|nr:hypothetical protein [Chromatium okenii]
MNGNGKIIALEPVQRNAGLLAQSVIENELSDVMTVLPIGWRSQRTRRNQYSRCA